MKAEQSARRFESDIAHHQRQREYAERTIEQTSCDLRALAEEAGLADVELIPATIDAGERRVQLSI